MPASAAAPLLGGPSSTPRSAAAMAEQQQHDPEYAEFLRQQANAPSCQRQSRRWAVYFGLVAAALLGFSIMSIKLLYFRDVKHGPPTITNGTAIEPNTGIEFPLHLQTTSSSSNLPFPPPAPPQVLAGCDAWEYKIPIPTSPKIIVGALGLYMDRAEAKRRLAKFGKQPLQESDVDLVVDALLQQNGGGKSSSSLSMTLRLVVHSSPPNGRIIEWWDQYTKASRTKECGGEQAGREQFDLFAGYFAKRHVKFQSGDEWYFERRGEDGALFVLPKQPVVPVGEKRIAAGCFARALFEAHIKYQKLGLLNLVHKQLWMEAD